MASVYADIALPVPLDRTFTYLIPPELESTARVGCRALVPFRKKYLTGIIVDRPSKGGTYRGNIKPIKDVLDPEPTISEELLQLTKWISEYYFAPWGEVLKAALPQGLKLESKRIVRLGIIDVEKVLSQISPFSLKRVEILKALSSAKELTIGQLQKRVNVKSINSLLSEMAKQGLVVVAEEIPSPKAKPKLEKFVLLSDSVKERASAEIAKLQAKSKKQAEILSILIDTTGSGQPVSVKQLLKLTHASLSSLLSLQKKSLVEIIEKEVARTTDVEMYEQKQEIVLNSHQWKALGEITKAIEAHQYQTFLLYGVTGSGKTQVYIEAIKEVLKRDKTAIVLVPEISLTPQIVRRFKWYFGDEIAVMHSRMSVGERFDAWRLTRAGKYKIVIGPRSAIFAPLKNLGLIVVDEEQEATYKQFDATPRYNARDVAIMRASLANAAVILGSATPSAESYHNALDGKYKLLELPERVDNAKLPRIEIVDMTEERKRVYAATKEKLPKEERAQLKNIQFSSISELLKNKIEDRLAKKEGIILLQNRRGFSPFVECPECGFVEICNNCNVTLTYHATKKHLRCHYCGFVKQPPDVCPRCGGIHIKFRGFGTQRVEEELVHLFPKAKILRMDLDTTTRKGSHDKMLRKFAEGEVDILLGTQMVAKGLDFSRVTLVGVISADTQMLLPDFRSAEWTFQLLTQVAGRAGRKALEGEVVIQTYQPQHYSLKYVVAHDFKHFYEEELQYREELDYPPYSRIALVELKGKNEKEVAHHAQKFAELLRHVNGHFTVLGPAPAIISKLRNLYRWHILIKDLKGKDPSGKILRTALTKTIQSYTQSALAKATRGVKLIVDVDPQRMM